MELAVYDQALFSKKVVKFANPWDGISLLYTGKMGQLGPTRPTWHPIKLNREIFVTIRGCQIHDLLDKDWFP